MIRDLGTVRPGQTLYLPFHTFDSNDPTASVTLTGLATTDIEVFKDGSVTQRASDNGYALLDTDGIDFDGITGIHGISIDLADNTTAGFYASGSQYWVVISSVTVDGATINFVLCTFRIGYPNAVLNTTIATLSSQTSFTLTAGPAEDDALNGREIIIHDVASGVQMGSGVILDYTGSTKTVTLAAALTFTIAATDNVAVMGLAPLMPTVQGRTLDVTAGGAAGMDWGNVENQGTSVGLSSTTVATVSTVTSVTALGADAITNASIENNAISSGKLAAGAIQQGTLADGLITAAKIGDNAITSAKINDGAITNAKVANDVEVVVGGWTTAGLAALFTSDSGETYADAVAGSPVKEIADNASGGGGGPSAADIADAVWDEARSGHTTNGTFGQGVASVQGNVTGSVGSVTGAVGSVTGNVGGVAGTTTTFDALQTALNSAHGAGSWATATGFSTHSAADVWAVGTRTITGGTITTYTGDTPQTGDVYAALTGAQSEPGQGAPAVNASVLTKIAMLYKAWRNRKTQTATEQKLYADDGTTVDQKATVSDDTTTTEVGEVVSGP